MPLFTGVGQVTLGDDQMSTIFKDFTGKLNDPNAFYQFGFGASQPDFYKNLDPNKIGINDYNKYKSLLDPIYVGKNQYEGSIVNSQFQDISSLFNEYRKKLDEIKAQKKEQDMYAETVQQAPGRLQTVLTGPGALAGRSLLLGGT